MSQRDTSGAADDDHADLTPATRLVTGGRRADWTHDDRLGGGIVNPPVWRASTTLYDTVDDLKARVSDTHDKLFYGRRGTPTVWSLADALTDLDPTATGTLLYPSGVAAISTAMLALLSPGDDVLLADTVYDPTRTLAVGLLRRLGVTARFYDPAVGAGIADLITPATRLIIMEAPGSLTFEMQDIPAIVAVAKAAGVATMLDNTWASPLGFAPVAHGVDIAMMSCTKHVVGHSDVLMGSLTVAPSLWDRVRATTYELGQSVSPDDCALALRGLRTMGVRLDRASESALTIAVWLRDHSAVGDVLCPMLPGSAGHDLWARDFTGGCGLFGFRLSDSDTDKRARFIDALRLFGIGYSFGGYESLALPVDPSPARRFVRAPDGAGPLVRLSIGLEDPADLIADIAQALAHAYGTR